LPPPTLQFLILMGLWLLSSVMPPTSPKVTSCPSCGSKVRSTAEKIMLTQHQTTYMSRHSSRMLIGFDKAARLLSQCHGQIMGHTKKAHPEGAHKDAHIQIDKCPSPTPP
jgi:hypothetical protein